MKFILFLIIILGISLEGYAQFDFGTQSTVIPPLNSNNKIEKRTLLASRFPSVNFPAISPPLSSFTKPSGVRQIGENSEANFMQKKEFENPGDIYEAKLNKKEGQEVSQVFRKNQYLGDFKTKSTFVHILYRDHEFVDGDKIKVYINDVLIQSEIVLDENFQELEVTLKSGFNKIDFEAINQGSSGPNTAEFQVYDDKENLVSANRWNLATGFKATVIIVKE